YSEVLTSAGDTGSLSLWLDGRAVQGPTMAMAATVALPESVPAQAVTLRHDRHRLALDVSLKVERGRTYVFTKYLAVSRAGWGGGASEDLTPAPQAPPRRFAPPLQAHPPAPGPPR